MRWGELAGLRRENVDLEACEIRIVETMAELDRGDLLADPPKSRAGRRTITFPAELVPELRWHLDRFAVDNHAGRPAGCAGRRAKRWIRSTAPSAGECSPSVTATA
jgi:integrase